GFRSGRAGVSLPGVCCVGGDRATGPPFGEWWWGSCGVSPPPRRGLSPRCLVCRRCSRPVHGHNTTPPLLRSQEGRGKFLGRSGRTCEGPRPGRTRARTDGAGAARGGVVVWPDFAPVAPGSLSPECVVWVAIGPQALLLVSGGGGGLVGCRSARGWVSLRVGCCGGGGAATG